MKIENEEDNKLIQFIIIELNKRKIKEKEK